MSTTALTIISTAFNVLNVFVPGESIPAADSATALQLLNNLVGRWALESGTIPAISRDVFPLVSGKGGTATPYTIGLGGDFNVPKPPSANALTGAGLLLGGTTPAVEIPRALINGDVYAAIRVKDLASALFTQVYYDPTIAGGLGAISLWPVPNTSLHSLVLYLQQPLTSFASLSATYDLPLGYDEAFTYNLAIRLATVYPKPITELLASLATTSLAAVKRSNATMIDLPVEPMFTTNARGGYNIQTGE